MRKYLGICTIGLLLCAVFLIVGCESNKMNNGDADRGILTEYQEQQFYLDTLIQITIYAYNPAQARSALDAAFAAYEHIHAIANRYPVDQADPMSDVMRINQSAGIKPEKVDPDTIVLIQAALQYAVESNNSFNPLMGPIIDLWGIGSDHPNIPNDKDLQATLALLNINNIRINADLQTVMLAQTGMSLDFGGIAKGYATDLAVQALREQGIVHALVDAGGNIYALGTKPEGTPWQIGIVDPRNADQLLGIASVTDQSVVTSGDYHRFFIANDTRYHHIFDPKTGYPASGLCQATIISERSIVADAASTVVFVLGEKLGKEWMEERGFHGILVNADLEKSVIQTAEPSIRLQEQ